MIRHSLIASLIMTALSCSSVSAQPTPTGQVQGSAFHHTTGSTLDVVQKASLALPSQVTGGAPYLGSYRDAPKTSPVRVPVVVFLHGSSGLGLKAIGEWQAWLAAMGVASIAPDSFALPDRLTYTSPVGKDVYEKIHALRSEEIGIAVQALRSAPWADPARLLLAGTSEGAVAVARYGGSEFAGRIIYSWSCEDNYMVNSHATSLNPNQPMLNVISSTDPYFSPGSTWLGNASAKGHCADAFKSLKAASVVLIPGAPHTVINLPPARHAAAGFIRDVLKP